MFGRSILVLGILLLFFASPGRTATIRALSCNSTDVNATIVSAKDGDTVAVPAGNCTWTSPILISNKGIILQGAGIDVTNITLVLDQGLRIHASSGSHVGEITGFTFIGSGTVDRAYLAVSIGPFGSERIHHNKFRDGRSRHIVAWSGDRLLIDHNSFSNIVQAMLLTNTDGKVMSFRKPINWGGGWDATTEWIFIEDNVFDHPCGEVSSPYDSQEGAKIVFRHNTVYNGMLVAHAACWSSATRTGHYASEIYSNTFIKRNGCQTNSMTNYMGGTLLLHDNRIEYWGTGKWNAERCGGSVTCPHNWQDARTLDTTHACNSSGNMWMYCNGANNMWCSGSTNTAWYTCNTTVDNCAAIGMGTCSKKHCSNSWNLCTVDSDCSGGGTCTGYLDNKDAASGRVCFNGTGAGRLNDVSGRVDSEPMYSWSNSLYTCNSSGGACVFSKSVDISSSNISTNSKVNVDFFNNTPKPGYLPYVYPHPLAELVERLASPTHLRTTSP